MKGSATFTFLSILTFWLEVRGHGRLLEPPSRASMFRFGFNTPPNYNDNQMFCGGFQNQVRHGGKCGVCGDPYQGPRDHEAGGPYATGTISRTYTQGQKFKVTVDITANHLGWFEFRLCPVNDKNVKATKKCLNKNLLPLSDGSGSRLKIGSGTGEYNVELTLPYNLTCTQCVLQWKYHTGNNWGVDADGTGCVGCGHQEEFYGCADIAIVGEGEQPERSDTPSPAGSQDTDNESGSESQSENSSEAQSENSSQSTCSARQIGALGDIDNEWCSNHCKNGCRKVLMCD